MVKYTTEHWNWAYYKGNYVPLQILQQINNSHILCVTPYTLSNEDCLMQWEIVTTKMSIPIIKWYRTFLAHTGCKQLQWQYKSDTIIQSLEKCCLFPFWYVNTTRSHAKEWVYYPNTTSPTQYGTKFCWSYWTTICKERIFLWWILWINMHWHHNQSCCTNE